MNDPVTMRRRLVAELRRLRGERDLTQRHVADELDRSPSKIIRIEKGYVAIGVTHRHTQALHPFQAPRHRELGHDRHRGGRRHFLRPNGRTDNAIPMRDPRPASATRGTIAVINPARSSENRRRVAVTDPPYETSPAHADGDGSATNESRPHRRSSRPRNRRGCPTTVTPPLVPREPDPPSGPPQGLADLWWRLAGDDRRAAWTLVFVIAFLAAFLWTMAIVGPQLPAIATGLTSAAAGIVGGGTVVGGAYGIQKAVRGRRKR